MFVLQLNFGDDQAGVLAGKDIDFPRTMPPRDDVADLLNGSSLAQPQEFLSFRHRERVFQLQPVKFRLARFNCQSCLAVALDANPDRCPSTISQIGLSNMSAAGCELLPLV